MTSASRIHHLLYRGPKALTDPGDGGTIRPTADLQICEMESGASAETRTLAAPTKAGIRFVLRLLTDGGGDVVVTASAGFNAALETTATFADASDILSLISVSLTVSTYRWEILEGNAGTSISTSTGTSTTTASASSSATASTTPSSSISKTATPSSSISKTATPSSTSTQSISGSDTASGTFSASATATSTTTPSATATSSTTPSSTSSSTTTPSSTSSTTPSSSATATGTP